MARCNQPCEIWSRVVGYFRPLADMNKGKRTEFTERKVFTKAGDQQLTPEPDHERIAADRASNPLFDPDAKV